MGSGPSSQKVTATETDTSSVADTADYLAQLGRRRSASQRLAVLESGVSDPWRYPAPSPTERNVQAARDTWAHLGRLGYVPADPAGREWFAWVLGVAS